LRTKKIANLGERKLFKKIMSSMFLTLILIVALTLALNIEPVKADGTIYIMSNGRVDPSTAPISTIDNITYTVTSDIDMSIVIEKSNIIINGNGHTLLGSGNGIGFNVTNISRVTIKNASVQEFSCGIFISSSTSVNISKSSIVDNTVGLSISSSSNNKIGGNNITGNDAGIVLTSNSDTNTINGNRIKYNNIGIELGSSSNANSIMNNNVTTNSNYGIILDTSANNNISRNNLETNNNGIELSYSSNNKLRNNTMANNKYNFNVSGSAITDFLNDVDNSNTVDGRRVYYWINYKNKTIPSDAGYVALVNCTRITVQNLNLTKNGEGVLLAYTSNSTIIQNNITSNDFGIRIQNSSGNHIYHNSFINNTNQVDTYGSLNAWDNGYPSGGNFWSDLSTTDKYRGPYQNQTGSDGIRDSSRTIDLNNRDNYPLVKPYGGPHDIGITNVTLSKTIVSPGYNSNVTVKVINYGIYTETFNLTLYANTTIIQKISVVLTSRNSTNVVYNWQTSGFAKGNYTIKAYASPVPGETYTKDNTFVGGWIFVLSSGHDVAIKGISCNPAVGQNFSSPIKVTVMNVGSYQQTFNVTVHANVTSIGVQSITLQSGVISTLNFTWNTSGFIKGNYKIWAYASPVPGETDLTDNNRTGGSMQITKVGDFGGVPPGSVVPQFGYFDGSCGADDIPLFLQCYRGTAPPQWEYLGDLGSMVNGVPTFFKCDGKCDATDLVLFIRCYRGTGP
jgi:parallel beta-helix repeat protein